MTPRALDDRGTALVLVPTMFLVLMALAVIALDLTALHGAHRSLHRTVSAAADDAAGMLDGHHLQRTGELRVDEERARRVALARLGAADLPGALDGPPSLAVVGDGTAVRITAAVLVPRVVAPGVDPTERIEVRVTGRMRP